MKIAPRFLLLVSLGLALPAAAAAQSWQEFNLPGTDFVVSTPGTPKVTEDGVDPDGVRAKTAQLKLGEVQYSVTHTVYPRGYVARGTAVIDLLNAARNRLAAAVAGRVVGERRFTLGDAHASEFVINVPPGAADPKPQSAKVRLYLRVLGATVILDQCVALGPRGSETGREAQRFLDSIRFTQG